MLELDPSFAAGSLLLLEATFIRDLRIVYRCELEDAREEVRECTLADYRAALAPQKDDRPEDARRRRAILADWERIFEIREEFADFAEEIEAAVFGDRDRARFERADSSGLLRTVVVERDRADADRCVVRFYRACLSEAHPPLDPLTITRVAAPVFLERRILKSGADFFEYEYPKLMAEVDRRRQADEARRAGLSMAG